MKWFRYALGLSLTPSLLIAPFSHSLPTNAQPTQIDPIFEVRIAQLHLELVEVEEPELPTPELLPPKVDCQVEKCVALTFDDGPSEHTIGILKSLERQGAKATFFALGLQLREYPEIAEQIVAQGHELAGHSYAHQKLQYLSRWELERDFSYVSKLMFEATGQRPEFFRPPYGEYDGLVREVASQPMVLWSVDPKDWLTKDAEQTYQRVVSQVEPGSIVVMHDILSSTRNAVPRILKTLKKRGYHFVTITELLGELTPGEIYRKGPNVKG